ncbi:MAG: pyrroline-5-carboxylate reductase dimerization domain-containing protein [Dysgonamonadaceae bacterium]
MNYGFIGFGNLASAIYRGLKGENGTQFAYFARNRKNVGALYFNNLEDLLAFADIIWLTIKPQDLVGILEQLQPLKRTGKTFVSPVAGKSICYIENYLGSEQTIVRIMPNLAIAYKKSVTAFATNNPNDNNASYIFDILSKLGKAVKLDESGFDLFTSVFGSGPAFILAFIQIFKDKMSEFDLSGDVLDELLLQLTEGTVSYFAANQENFSIEELIQNITSKGGTTQAGLDYFRKHDIGKHFEGVLDAARNRSAEMSKE